MGDKGFNLPRATLCATCGERIWPKGAKVPLSWCAPAPDFVERHRYCAYPEMAVAGGDDDDE